jgi:1-acyl-sn-glycerol-3-phosphate acyltransferase
MAVFPEATSDGSGILPFKASLFEAALPSRSTVQPVSMRYQLPDGSLTTAPAYAGDTTFWQSIKLILAQPAKVALTYGQRSRRAKAADHPLRPVGTGISKVCLGLRLPLPDTPVGSENTCLSSSRKCSNPPYVPLSMNRMSSVICRPSADQWPQMMAYV